jgi:regulator of protease activity HflC (stomatin/prohibitin superfamily)
MPSTLVRRVEAWISRHFIGFATTAILAMFLLVYFAGNIFITIPPGYGGALYLRFFGGTVLNFHYGEGMKLIFPWDRIYLYDLRVQQETESFDVLTSEGLAINIEATLRFRLNPNALGTINRYAGPQFIKTLVMPTVGAALRLEAAQYTLEQIFSTKRHEIESNILGRLRQAVDDLIIGEPEGKPEIDIEDLWFRSVQFPQDLKTAIEAKLTQRQLAEQYTYILEREEKERQRKIIEAEGIKSFQDIVSSGISENYLRWKGIDATLKLAESPNSKIVIIGGGKDGLPLILGPWDSAKGTVLQGAAKPSAEVAPRKPGSAALPSSASSGTNAPSRSTNPFLKNVPGMPPEPLALDPHISMPPPPPGGPITLDAAPNGK